MPNNTPFGHALQILLLSGCAALMTACATTAPAPQDPGPVVQRPVTPAQPITENTNRSAVQVPETKDVEAPAPVTPNNPAENNPAPAQPAQAGPYFNTRDGLTPPHLTGRDTKRLALLLPFSTSSTRLAQEAQSMYRAAEMAVFDRQESDVLLIALDTKGTEAGARSATKAAVKAGADVILGPILANNCLLYTSDAADE